jgi:predicted DNA repair protein MutK
LAASSLLALIDDIATILDDVAAMTKVAAKKTAGVLGDDLALNAEQVTGVKAERELPVVWAVAKGSFRNKLILVPAALAISALAPWAVTPLLMLGGAFLCYEGFEKIAHALLHARAEDEAHHADLVHTLSDPTVDVVAFEKEKISGAIRTDFVLSAEIISITLGTVAGAEFATQVIVLSGIAVIMTIGVYGIVAGILKLDDAGLRLTCARAGSALYAARRALGRAILAFAPYLMKTLSVLGTAAMFIVGGGILVHGLPGAADLVHRLAEYAPYVPLGAGALEALARLALSTFAGVLSGALLVGAVTMVRRVYARARGRHRVALP